MKYSRTNPKPTSIFVAEAIALHGSQYDYSNVEYKNYLSFVKIGCAEHGEFSVRADHHLKGAICPSCRHDNQRREKNLGKESFIERAKEIHGDDYLYDKVEYLNARTKVTITCPEHGDFDQQPRAHLYSATKCPRCSKSGTSKIEHDWLDSMGLPNTKTHRRVRLDIGHRTMLVDGYDPSTNTVYEFHGDYWHGNPKVYDAGDVNRMTKCTFGELYHRTQQTEDFIRKAGYNLVVCWESDFKSN